MTQNEKIVEGYLKLQEDKLLSMEANTLRILCEDYMKRARKDRELGERLSQWQKDAPITFVDKHSTDNLKIVLPTIINSFRHEVEEVTNYLHADQRIIWDNAMRNLEERLRTIIK